MKQDLTSYPAMTPSFTLTEVEANAKEATIVIEPLEKGYGHTLGNALRRIMLSSLPGCAITKVRIKGVEHQYTGLAGVTEDMIEILLNLKSLRIKSTTDDSATFKLDIKGPKEVTAKDIEVANGFEIINLDQSIATVAKGKTLDIEMTVESGVGYLLSTEISSHVVGEIPVDALFSPVIKVSYDVEDTRVGRRTDYDRIIFNITTNGSLAPLEAIKEAAQILAKQATQVFNPTVVEVVEEEEKLSPEEAEVLSLTVEELDLPTRIANALRKGGFATVGDLQGVSKAIVAKVKNLGEKSVDIIGEALEKKGVSLGE